jgi:hypothetical protein
MTVEEGKGREYKVRKERKKEGREGGGGARNLRGDIEVGRRGMSCRRNTGEERERERKGLRGRDGERKRKRKRKGGRVSQR